MIIWTSDLFGISYSIVVIGLNGLGKFCCKKKLVGKVVTSSWIPTVNSSSNKYLINFLSNHIKTEIINLPNTTKGKDPISTKSVIKIGQELHWEKQETMWFTLVQKN